MSRPLAENTTGNPRQFKRFTNMLLLRHMVAETRGLKAVYLNILAKMMLAGYFHNAFYKELANHLDANGKGKDLEFSAPVEEDKNDEEKVSGEISRKRKM